MAASYSAVNPVAYHWPASVGGNGLVPWPSLYRLLQVGFVAGTEPLAGVYLSATACPSATAATGAQEARKRKKRSDQFRINLLGQRRPAQASKANPSSIPFLLVLLLFLRLLRGFINRRPIAIIRYPPQTIIDPNTALSISSSFFTLYPCLGLPLLAFSFQ